MINLLKERVCEGEVARTTGFTNFEADGMEKQRLDPGSGRLLFHMTMYAAGALMLVLEKHEYKTYVLTLDSGTTGWVLTSALEPYKYEVQFSSR
jgi:hypothetical protein